MAAEKYEPETSRRRWTNEEYLAFERAADEKHEMINGHVFLRGAPHLEVFPDEVLFEAEEIRAMAGASLTHNSIVVATVSSLYTQLRGSTCRSFANDLRVQVGEKNDYVYPDIVVACEPQLAQSSFDTLLNPTVIIEVLSPSTEAYDRSEKWLLYQKLPSLREYVLVLTDKLRVECYSRQGDNSWLYRTAESLEGNIALESVGATLSLREVYERVTFGAPEAPQPTREYSQEKS